MSAACVDLSLPAELEGGFDAGSLELTPPDGGGLSSEPQGKPDVDANDGPQSLVVIDAAAPADAPVAPADATAPQTGMPLPDGRRCGKGDDCTSGHCVDGVCCAVACNALCYTCNTPGSEGSCLAVPAGQDQAGECEQDPPSTCARDGACDGAGSCRRYPAGTICEPGSCSGALEQAARTCDGNGVCKPGTSRACTPNSCAGSSCGTVCASNADCQVGFLCEGGTCRSKRAMGAACTAPAQCASGYCANGVCCGTPCTERCHVCNLASSLGTCAPAADGTDPGNDCPPEAAATCGRSGACNGRGACRLQPPGTPCAQAGCSGGKELGASTCNGSGVCTASSSRDCGAFACAGGTCATSCTTTAQCAAGRICVNGDCQTPTQAALHWKMDEETGTAALDASGNALQGTYLGTSGTPMPAMMAPPVMFANPRSRLFVQANRQAIQLTPMPAALKPANNVTLSVWFRATKVDSSGAELLSGGNQYLLRINDDALRFSRRVAGSSGSIQCEAQSSTHLDDKWHHLAGVLSPQGMKLYLDGAERCTNTRGEDIRYDGTPELLVGRHPDSSAYDFDGHLDDVRIYARALSADEIMRLFQGLE